MSLILPASGVAPNSTVWIGYGSSGKRDGIPTGNTQAMSDLPLIGMELPQGIEVGELQFPHPERVQMAGVKAYGHYGDTLYLARLQVADVPLGDEVKLRAKARWMVCSHVCLPQYNELTISLPLVDSPEPDPQWQARFAEFLQDRPLPLPPAWKMQATELGQFTKLTISNAPDLSAKSFIFLGAVTWSAPMLNKRSATRATVQKCFSLSPLGRRKIQLIYMECFVWPKRMASPRIILLRYH